MLAYFFSNAPESERNLADEHLSHQFQDYKIYLKSTYREYTIVVASIEQLVNDVEVLYSNCTMEIPNL